MIGDQSHSQDECELTVRAKPGSICLRELPAGSNIWHLEEQMKRNILQPINNMLCPQSTFLFCLDRCLN